MYAVATSHHKVVFEKDRQRLHSFMALIICCLHLDFNDNVDDVDLVSSMNQTNRMKTILLVSLKTLKNSGLNHTCSSMVHLRTNTGSIPSVNHIVKQQVMAGSHNLNDCLSVPWLLLSVSIDIRFSFNVLIGSGVSVAVDARVG